MSCMCSWKGCCSEGVFTTTLPRKTVVDVYKEDGSVVMKYKHKQIRPKETKLCKFHYRIMASYFKDCL